MKLESKFGGWSLPMAIHVAIFAAHAPCQVSHDKPKCRMNHNIPNHIYMFRQKSTTYIPISDCFDPTPATLSLNRKPACRCFSRCSAKSFKSSSSGRVSKQISWALNWACDMGTQRWKEQGCSYIMKHGLRDCPKNGSYIKMAISISMGKE